MELGVLVFDRNELRGTQVGAAVIQVEAEQGPSMPPLRVSATDSSALLQKVLEGGGADILLVVLDDESGATDGVDLVARMIPPKSRVQIIYVDVSGTHATSVYKTPHVYLLSWPLVVASLASALRKAIENHERWAEHPLIVRVDGTDRVLQPSEIAYVESDRRLLRIHLSDEVVETYGKLSELARKLPSSFVQSHKSFLVNMAFIRELRNEGIVLTTGDKVPMSQKRRKATRDAFRGYVGRVL